MPKTKQKFEVKELRPRDIDAKYFGTEPNFADDPNPKNEKWALAIAFNWYSKFYDKKAAREFVVEYLEAHGKNKELKLFKKVADGDFKPTYGWLARCRLRGLSDETAGAKALDIEIARLISTIKTEHKEEKVEEVQTNRPNVQEIMLERSLEAGGELEGYFDDYLKSGAKKDFDTKVIGELQNKNILPQHVPVVSAPWQQRLDEYKEVLSGEDNQLNEGYSRFTKTQIKNIISYIEKTLSDLNSYITLKKAGRKPRIRKAVPVEKRVAKLKYMRAFKDTAAKLDLVSIPPTKLHGASEAWVYDTAKRKMYHYVADEYTKELIVKGNTVLGFCTKDSEVKTLRKPAEQIKQIMGSKPAARKFFKEIKAVSTTPKGRFNPNMIILRAF